MRSIKLRNLSITVIATMTLLFLACQNDDDFQQDSFPPNDNSDANAITESLKFRNATIISGDIPKSASLKNNVIADLKIDTDTIFWVEGVINRLKILKPKDSPLFTGSFYAQVEGSDNHVEAEFDMERENDTIVFFDFDFNLTGWEPPLSFNIKLAPKDDASATPVDEFNLPVIIEELKNNNGSCNFNDIDNTYWEWMSTWQNDSFHTGPLVWFFQDSTIGGCCDPKEGSYIAGCSPNNPDYTELSYINNYMVRYDFFKIGASTNVTTGENTPQIYGRMQEGSNNADALTTDFCSTSASTQQSIKSNFFSSEFNQSNCTFTLENMEGESEEVIIADGVPPVLVPLPIYMGSGDSVQYQILSDHFIKEVRQNLEGGPNGGLVRYYIKRDITNPDNFERLRWTD
ncbi:MAG: hypothetical protein QNJ57_05295 [Flavobacteriaceae bacterium]|nr:hypothetical protein [Flavobacteriaceae bacterium]